MIKFKKLALTLLFNLFFQIPLSFCYPDCKPLRSHINLSAEYKV